ncbi:MAG: type II toxin-antitoxin system Phd/YefM family antitoxin [Pseudomonadota bacterium]
MSIRQMTSRELNQDLARAKREACGGPVIITDRGRPAHVLMEYEDYRRLTGEGTSIIDALAMPSGEEIDFDPPTVDISLKTDVFD